jgi:maleate isomerase
VLLQQIGNRVLDQFLETRGIPVVIPGLAAVRELGALCVRRLALVDPPWFSAELNRMGADYFSTQQIEVVYAAPATGLPSSQHDQDPARLYEWVRADVPTNAEAVLTGSNGFQAVGAIEAPEKDLGHPVLTANQVTFWNALHAADPNI